MKKLIISTLIAIIAVLAIEMQAYADDLPGGIEVSVVVIGDNATLSVTSDGDGTTVFINGRSINDPITYFIENNYDDATLKQAVSELQTLFDSMNCTVSLTTIGLSKVILVLQEHTSNLNESLEMINQNEKESVLRDDNLAKVIQDKVKELDQRADEAEARLTRELTEEQTKQQTAIEQVNNRVIWSFSATGGVFVVLLTLLLFLHLRER